MTEKKKTVVVIGGGLSGLYAIKGLRKLDNDVEIILIEPKLYVEMAWCAYRSPFDETVAEMSLFTLEPWLKEHNVIHKVTTVTKLTSTSVTLATGETIEHFSACVICVGASHSWQACGRGPPAKGQETREARLACIKAEGERLVVNAKSVLIIGGGLIGSELAGDLAVARIAKYGAANVTLVQSESQLCPEMKPEAAALVQAHLEKSGVKVVLGKKVNVMDNGKAVYQTSGEPVVSDGEGLEIVKTVGLQPIHSSFLSDSSWTDEKGWLKIDDEYRVLGAGGRIFALGDCTPKFKFSFSQLKGQKDVIGFNLKATIDNAKDEELPSWALKQHKPEPFAVICTTGPSSGVAHVQDTFYTQYGIHHIKHQTMYVMPVRMDLGLASELPAELDTTKSRMLVVGGAVGALAAVAAYRMYAAGGRK